MCFNQTNRFHRTIVIASAGLLALATLRPLSAAAVIDSSVPVQRLDHHDFEGEWKVDITPDDDARRHHGEEMHDRLIFKGDQFYSEELKKHGFEAAHFDQDTRRDGPGQFSAKCHSDGEGDIEWHGVKNADQLSGTMVWHKPNGDVLNFNFQSE